MGYVKKIAILGVFSLFAVTNIFSQELSQPAQQLADYCQQTAPTGDSPRLNVLTLAPKSNIHYLFPLYHAFRDQEKFRKIYSDKGYCDEVSQYFAFVGDYRTALQYQIKTYDTITEGARRKVYRIAENLNNIRHAKAQLYIRLAAKNRKVVMINEAFSKPLHRAFTLSLLASLYREGYHYLAMEMLNNFPDQSLPKVSMLTGYYVAEPTAAELVREARDIGFTLVPYEDTAAARHTPTQRDSVQAENIYDIIRKDSSARILVHASYGHISKRIGPDGYIPMALAFRRLSGIDPLTIDQTDMTEESNSAYGRAIYQAYLQQYPITEPSIALRADTAISVMNGDLYDLCVIHPPTVYQDGRPTWMSFGGTRQQTYIKPPDHNTFLIQAYYQDEIDHNDNTPWQLVPADQTYMPSGRKGSVMLYLKKGKYKVFFRDMNYHILNTLAIEVN